MYPPMGGGFPGMGPTPGSAALDQPPPSPTPMGGVDQNSPFSMQGVASQIPSNQMPPEVLTGVTQSASTVNDMFNSWSQVAPDQQGLIAMMQQLLQQFLANIMQSGSGPTSPTASGPGFPGGGIDRGLAGAGTV